MENRYYRGELPHELLLRLYGTLGGTPRFLTQVREALKDIGAEELAAELDALHLPPDDAAAPGELQRLRDDYFETIFLPRLFGHLTQEEQRALSRAAVYGLPVTLEGLAAVADQPVEQVRGHARRWRDLALAHREQGRTGGDLWTVYGLLKSWLLAPERLAPADRTAAHQAAGDFLRDLVDLDREAELGLDWMECLEEARVQYLAAGVCEPVRAVSYRLSNALLRTGLYANVIRLNEDALRCEQHPGPMVGIARALNAQAQFGKARSWYAQALRAAADDNPDNAAAAWHGLAIIGLHQGDYPAAREKFGTALEIRQAIGDRAGEAAAWHGLASTDLEQDDYPAAREKFGTALEIRQAIGDRAGEAAVWHQLATIDLRQHKFRSAAVCLRYELALWQALEDRHKEGGCFFLLGKVALALGRPDEGIRLLAVCYVIDHQIGHPDADEKDLPALREAAATLGHDEDHVASLLEEEAQQYAHNRGEGLLAAFDEDQAPTIA